MPVIKTHQNTIWLGKSNLFFTVAMCVNNFLSFSVLFIESQILPFPDNLYLRRKFNQ